MSEDLHDAVHRRVVSGTRGTPAFLAPELLKVGLDARDMLQQSSTPPGPAHTTETSLENDAAAAAAAEAIVLRTSRVDGEDVEDDATSGMTSAVTAVDGHEKTE